MDGDTASESSPRAEEQAVLTVLHALLDAISDRDGATMQEILMPDGGATHSRDDLVFHMRLGDEPRRWLEGAGSKKESLKEPLIRIDDDIAMVWVAYDVFVDGEPHHWGTNIVSFLKRDGRWRISGIADNGRSGARPTA